MRNNLICHAGGVRTTTVQKDDEASQCGEVESLRYVEAASRAIGW